MISIVQVDKKGRLTIPIAVRKRYGIENDDLITLVDIGAGILHSPQHAVLQKLVGEIELLRKKNSVTVGELVKAVHTERE